MLRSSYPPRWRSWLTTWFRVELDCRISVGPLSRPHGMTQSLEALTMMDGGSGNTVTFGKKRGYVVSRGLAIILGLLFVGGLVATGLLVHKFSSCVDSETSSLSSGVITSERTRGKHNSTTQVLIPTPSTEVTTPSPPQVPPKAPKLDVRLPRAIKPDSYDIKIIPFIVEGNFTFHGAVSIVLNVTQDTRNVTLHVNDIKVLQDTVEVVEKGETNGSVAVERVSNDSARQFLVLHLAGVLAAGRQYTVRMRYIGNLNDALQGFYRSSYIVNNQTRWVAATQFQPTDARRAFPCFDEPALKAKFKISIARPRNMTSISNMPQEGPSQPVEGILDYEWDHYGLSLPMSTYLVAFVVSDFAHKTDGNFSVWAREEALQQAQYSLEIGPKILKYFEDYFEIKFPLPKIDMIALPVLRRGCYGELGAHSLQGEYYLVTTYAWDGNSWPGNEFWNGKFASTGDSAVASSTLISQLHNAVIHLQVAENICVICEDMNREWVETTNGVRETAMLYKQGVSTNNNKQSVATVVSHELAHQWFGNLVTPSWWTDLWLNEGFASYVEYLGVNAVEESWKILEQFVIFDLQNVFALDALESSHQISIEVGHPDEINEIFDRISYGKGASIIRMMDHFLTTEVFKKGVTRYLKNKAFQSSTQNDLWSALTVQAHESKLLNESITVKDIMDTWTLQTGFPVLTVIRDYETGSAILSQERFLLCASEPKTTSLSKAGAKPTTPDPLWWIPITYTTMEQPDFETTKPSSWLGAESSINLTGLPAGDQHWVIFNIKETGFYRVNYDEMNWRLLIGQLQDRDRFQQIGVINRAQLLDDALNLARAGLLNYSTALDVTKYLSTELEYLPWKAAFTGLGYINNMLIKTGNYDKLKTYLLVLVDNLYRHTGFTDNPSDPQLTVYKRVNVLSWACLLGFDDCVRNSVTQFQNWMSTPNPDRNNPISANLKSVVYCSAIRVGGQDEWDFAWQRYRNTNVGSEKDILLGALGCTRETWILSRYLEWSVLENSGIRKQDSARVFSSVSSNPIGQPLAYNFLRNKWDKIKEYLGSSLFAINNIVRSSTRHVNEQFELDDIMKFSSVHHHELGTATRAVEQAIEQARANVKWMERNYWPIVNWLGNVTAVVS
uniref:Aminopeptidase N n=1 Tax=Timema cristinae TaxID=61476 RepID=A0A7R9GSD9_TIMCR|nr:unnamed protein product [Timema cristinae]